MAERGAGPSRAGGGAAVGRPGGTPARDTSQVVVKLATVYLKGKYKNQPIGGSIGSNNPGEVVSFSKDIADDLVDRGMATYAGEEEFREIWDTHYRTKAKALRELATASNGIDKVPKPEGYEPPEGTLSDIEKYGSLLKEQEEALRGATPGAVGAKRVA